MGKRKQRKTKEAHKVEQIPLQNQENKSGKANQSSPSKSQRDQPNAVENIRKNGGSQFNENYSSQKMAQSDQDQNQKSKEKNSNTNIKTIGTNATNLSQNKKQMQIQKEKESPQKQLQEFSMQKNQQNQPITVSQDKQGNKNLQQQIQTLNNVVLSGKHQQKQMPNQYILTQEMDSSLEEDFNIADDIEYDIANVDDEGVGLSYREDQGNSNNGFGGDYYDELEYYEDVVNQLNLTKEQQQFSQNQEFQNQNAKRVPPIQGFNKARTLQRTNFPRIVDIKNDEQFQADLSHCLFCIYNNKELDDYFKQLMNIQRILKEGRHYIMPQLVADVFVQNIKEFMRGIKIRIVQDMKNQGIIQKVQIQRRYSYDDFFLVDNQFNRTLSLNGHHFNEFIGNGIHYLLGDQYEKARNIARSNMLRQMQINRYKVVHFWQGPEAYKRNFDMIIRYYTKVRDSVIDLEEMWVFLMESVYQQELKGNLIFEQIHKQLFDTEILKSQHILEFLNDIKSQYNAFQLKRKQRQNITKVESILENLYSTLLDLEDEINFQFADNDQECLRKESQETNDQTDPDHPTTNSQDQNIGEEQQQDEMYSVILTYEQLKERTREKQGGMTLAESVQLYETQAANSNVDLLKQIKQNIRHKELMSKLHDLDTETICYIIENKITPEACEKILQESRLKQANQPGLINNQNNNNQVYIQNGGDQMEEGRVDFESDDEDFLISPAKNIIPKNKVSQNEFFNSYSLSNEEDKNTEREMEKKKRKNKKKKRKRKEKKIMAQQQLQLDELWYQKLRDELDQRELTEQFFSKLQNVSKEEYDQIMDQLRDPQYPQRVSLSHRQPQTNGQNLRMQMGSAQQYPIRGDVLDQEIMIMTEENEDEPDSHQVIESDKEFEEQLRIFKEKLDQISKEATQKKRKLIPNVSKGWINQLQCVLSSQYSFSSPKGGNSLISDAKGALWLSKQQYSA